MSRADGNVVYADFPRRRLPALPQMSFTCETLYRDEHALLIRLTYRLGTQTLIQHIASGVGLDA